MWCISAVNRPFFPLPCRAAWRTPTKPCDTLSRRCVRHVLAWSWFFLASALPSMPSAGRTAPLFGHFVGTTALSDSPQAFVLGLWLIAFSNRSARYCLTDTYGVSRFSRMECPSMPGVCDCAGATMARDPLLWLS